MKQTKKQTEKEEELVKETRGRKKSLPWKKIIQCIKDGVPIKLIAQTFGCTTQAIYYIRLKSGLIKDPLNKYLRKRQLKEKPLAFDFSDEDLTDFEEEDEEDQII